MRKPNLVTSLIILNLILIAALIFLSTNQWVKAQSTQLQTVPPWISYQGFLTDDTGQPVDGTKDLVFRIYASESDTTALWQEAHTDVQISAGDFAVHLGEFTPFGVDLFDSPDRWLEIEVEGTTLSPRQLFTSVPSALNADKLDGLDSQELLSGKVPSGAIVWFPEGSDPAGFTPHPSALGEDVGPFEPIAVSPTHANGYYQCNIWTGTDILCWGSKGSYTFQPSGSRYDYIENLWKPISTVGAPESQKGFSQIWTGTEMIVFGGLEYLGLGEWTYSGSGARYNPVTDIWVPISNVNAPSPRAYHDAIWTGSEMIIWGGYYFTEDYAFRYNPVSDTWMAINLDGAPLLTFASAIVWTGSEMIVFGGGWGSGFVSGYTFFADMEGAIYNPSTDSWRPMSFEGGVTFVTNGPYPPTNWDDNSILNFPNSSVVVWTGTEMAFLYGNHLFFYNPVTDTWREKNCFQDNIVRDIPLGQRIALVGNYIITQGSIFDITKDQVIAKFPALYWSNIFWTGQELLILEAPDYHASITGNRHQIELIFPYQKD